MTEFLHYAHIRMSVPEFLRIIFAGIAAVLTYAFGGADGWLLGLIVLVVTDYVSGVIAAYLNNELNSKRGFAGILKKLLLFCLVAVANIIDERTGADGVLRSAAIGFIMANEGLSVLENAGRCGVKLPKRLMAALEQLRGDHEAEFPDDEDCFEGDECDYPDWDVSYENDGQPIMEERTTYIIGQASDDPPEDSE